MLSSISAQQTAKREFTQKWEYKCFLLPLSGQKIKSPEKTHFLLPCLCLEEKLVLIKGPRKTHFLLQKRRGVWQVDQVKKEAYQKHL